jgi:hypothetical protein
LLLTAGVAGYAAMIERTEYSKSRDSADLDRSRVLFIATGVAVGLSLGNRGFSFGFAALDRDR